MNLLKLLCLGVVCVGLVASPPLFAQQLKPEMTVKTKKGQVLCLAFSPDGMMLASGHGGGTLMLWSVATGKEVAMLPGHTGQVISLAFSPDRKTLASGCSDQTIKLWNVIDCKEIVTLKGHTLPVAAVAYSPDGKTLASADGEGAVLTWDGVTGKEIDVVQKKQMYQ